MRSDATDLRQEIDKLQKQLKIKESELNSIVQYCVHKWSEPMPDHIYHEAYTTKGDAPGTMGVDFQGPTFIPAETIHQWKRICSVCGKVEHTRGTKSHVTKTPDF